MGSQFSSNHVVDPHVSPFFFLPTHVMITHPTEEDRTNINMNNHINNLYGGNTREKLYAQQYKVQDTLKEKVCAIKYDSTNVPVQWYNITKCVRHYE
jgi:hypothetical protein